MHPFYENYRVVIIFYLDILFCKQAMNIFFSSCQTICIKLCVFYVLVAGNRCCKADKKLFILSLKSKENNEQSDVLNVTVA